MWKRGDLLGRLTQSWQKMVETWPGDVVKGLKRGWILHTYFEGSTKNICSKEKMWPKREKGVENEFEDFDLNTQDDGI